MKKMSALFISYFLITLSISFSQDAMYVGPFARWHTDNKIQNSDLEFQSIGARIGYDAGAYDIFLDIGSEEMQLDLYENIDQTMTCGLGALFWLVENEDFPVDIGLAGAVYVSDYTLDGKDVRYNRSLAQVALRGVHNNMFPYIKAGIQMSDLDVDKPDSSATFPAVNIGCEVSVNDSIRFRLEGSFARSAGVDICMSYRF